MSARGTATAPGGAPGVATVAPRPADAAASYWSVAWAQLRKNAVAMFALGCVRLLLAVAVAAPLLAFNVPFVLRVRGAWSAPFLDRLFDRFVFPGGVDVFFNLILLVGPLWWLAARLARGWRTPGPRAAVWAWTLVAVALVAYLGFGLATGAVGVGRVLAVAGAPGCAVAAWAATRGRAHLARDRKVARWTLLAVFLGAFGALMTSWRDTSPLVDFRARATDAAALERERAAVVRATANDPIRRAEAIAADPGIEDYVADPDRASRWPHEGFAIFPMIHYHPDNVGELGPEPAQRSLRKPDAEHWLGCDLNGRDVTARLLFGTRISMTIGLVAVSIFITIGVLLGSLAGYYQGWVDLLISRLIEVMICFPTLFLLLTIIAIFETRSIFLIMGVIGLVGWPGVSRLVRGEFLRQRNLDYVTAARSQGIPQRLIIFGHVLPNCMGPVLVSATFGIASSILTESGLAFLGLGDTTAASWGQMLNSGRSEGQWHLIFAPGAAIFFVVTTFNLLGEGLRDALDPKLRR